eukprot:scaffold2747_cov104-Cylindrotheca_fusiformis.AAC.4
MGHCHFDLLRLLVLPSANKSSSIQAKRQWKTSPMIQERRSKESKYMEMMTKGQLGTCHAMSQILLIKSNQIGYNLNHSFAGSNTTSDGLDFNHFIYYLRSQSLLLVKNLVKLFCGIILRIDVWNDNPFKYCPCKSWVVQVVNLSRPEGLASHLRGGNGRKYHPQIECSKNSNE